MSMFFLWLLVRASGLRGASSGGWQSGHLHSDAAKNLTAKFKYLQKVLRFWSRSLSNLKENIAWVKLVLDLLNLLEEFRDLSLVEWQFNFRWYQYEILPCKCYCQIQKKSDYSDYRWFKGLFYNQGDKGALIWIYFKDRLGKSDFIVVSFDFLPFGFILVSGIYREKIEIDQVVTSLPSNKALGPDGFNTDFIKSVGQLSIYEDFYLLCKDFYDEQICLHTINGSFITLILKKDDNDEKGSDYMLISLLNTIIMIITKILLIDCG